MLLWGLHNMEKPVENSHTLLVSTHLYVFVFFWGCFFFPMMQLTILCIVLCYNTISVMLLWLVVFREPKRHILRFHFWDLMLFVTLIYFYTFCQLSRNIFHIGSSFPKDTNLTLETKVLNEKESIQAVIKCLGALENIAKIPESERKRKK